MDSTPIPGPQEVPSGFMEPEPDVNVPEEIVYDEAELDQLRRDVGQHAGLDVIQELLRNPHMELESTELDAYLLALTVFHRRSAVVLTRFGATEMMRERERDTHNSPPPRAFDHIYGADPDEADMILIPRLAHRGGAEAAARGVVGHFTLGIYFPRTGQLHHMDSLRYGLNEELLAFYSRVVASLHNHQDPQSRQFRLAHVSAVPSRAYNEQTDGYNCGFWVQLYAEMALRDFNRLFLPAFGPIQMQLERDRMLNWLRELLEGGSPTFRPAPPSQQGPTGSIRLSSRQSAPSIPSIGPHVPYHTDASLHRTPGR